MYSHCNNPSTVNFYLEGVANNGPPNHPLKEREHDTFKNNSYRNRTLATTQFAEASNYTCAKGQMGLGSGEWMGHSYSTNTTDPEAAAHCEATAGCTGFDLYEHVQADSCRLTRNSTGFQLGTSVRDICTKTDALSGNGQPMAQFFGLSDSDANTAAPAVVSPPTCDTGYTAVSGDISGWGSINGKGGGQVVVSTGECASLCG